MNQCESETLYNDPFFFLNPNLFLMPFDCRDENSCTTQCFPKKNVTILWDSCMNLSSWEIILKATPRVLSSASQLQTKIKVVIEFHSGSSQWRHTGLLYSLFSSVQFSCSVVSDSLRPHDHSMPGFPVHHQLLGFAQTHVHRVGDAIQPSHPLLSPSPPAFNLSQHQGLFQWVSFSHQVAKVLELVI